MKRRRLLVLLVLALASAVAWLGPTGLRAGVMARIHASNLEAPNPTKRARARQGLLALGPAGARYYPEVVASEVLDETTGVEAAVLVASATSSSLSYEVTRVVHASPGYRSLAKGSRIEVSGEPVCPTARLLRGPPARPELLVVGRRGEANEARLIVPLEGERGASVLAAVEATLRRARESSR